MKILGVATNRRCSLRDNDKVMVEMTARELQAILMETSLYSEVVPDRSDSHDGPIPEMYLKDVHGGLEFDVKEKLQTARVVMSEMGTALGLLDKVMKISGEIREELDEGDQAADAADEGQEHTERQS